PRRRPLLEDKALADRALLSMGPELDVGAGAAVLPELLSGAAEDDPGHRRRARARVGRRLGDDRPDLAGGVDSAGEPGGAVPHLKRRAAEGLQPVRHAAREP